MEIYIIPQPKAWHTCREEAPAQHRFPSYDISVHILLSSSIILAGTTRTVVRIAHYSPILPVPRTRTYFLRASAISYIERSIPVQLAEGTSHPSQSPLCWAPYPFHMPNLLFLPIYSPLRALYKKLHCSPVANILSLISKPPPEVIRAIGNNLKVYHVFFPPCHYRGIVLARIFCRARACQATVGSSYPHLARPFPSSSPPLLRIISRPLRA